MKVLTILSLILTLNKPIMIPKYNNPTNNTGNSDYNYFSQISYNYTNDNGVALGGVGVELNFSLVFRMNIVVNFKEPVEHATIHMFLTTPNSSSHTLNYISEFCTINFASNYEFEIVANNTNVCYITLIYSYDMIHDMYGYDWFEDGVTSPYEDEWIQNGDDYVWVYSARMDSITLSTSDNYNSQLNSLLANTDTLESLLQTIVTNTNRLSTIQSTLTTISTNINSIKTTLTNLYNLLDERFLTDDLYEALLQSAEQKVKNPNDIFNNEYLTYLPTQFAYIGPGTPGYQTIYSDSQEINTAMNKNSLKVIFRLSGYSSSPYYYLNIPVGTSSTLTETTEELYIYNKSQNRIYQITLMVRYNNDTVSIYAQGRYRLTSNPVSSTGTNADTFSELYITDTPITSEEYLSALLSSFNSGDDIVVDTTDKDTVDLFFNNLKENIRYPNMPQLPDLNLVNYFWDYFNTGLLGGGNNVIDAFHGYYKWISVLVITLVLRVILI